MRTNDYFTEFGFTPLGVPEHSSIQRIEHVQIPDGYTIFRFKKVLIPVREARLAGTELVEYCQYYRGSGTNPHTMDVPIHYIDNQGGLRRAMHFLQEMAVTETRGGN